MTTHPGETLQEWLSYRDWTQQDLANAVGRPLKTVNEIIKGKSRITEKTALQLEAVTRVPAEFWLIMQMNHTLQNLRNESP